MTYEQLRDSIYARWDLSRRMTRTGRAIILSSRELEMLMLACNDAMALRESQSQPVLPSPQDIEQ